MWYLYRREYYSAIKKNEILAFLATCMDLEIIMLSEVSHTMGHQHPMLSLIYWNLKCGTDEPITKQKQTHRHGEQTCGCQGVVGREWDGLGVWG